MNTENFKPLTNLSLSEIEEKQMEIMFRYEPSEKEIFENFDIDTYEDQEIFKKYCWRVTEELTEALEDTSHPQHFKEEITDAFNFLLELYNLYGWSVTDLSSLNYVPNGKGEDLFLPENKSTLESMVMQVVKQIGLSANLLKNRKWRQSQYLVDLYIFEKRFKLIWDYFLKLLAGTGISVQELFDQWSLKYQVNLYRIRTNY